MDGPSLHKGPKICRFEREGDILENDLLSKKEEKGRRSKIAGFETT